jgi:hypothetical protein
MPGHDRPASAMPHPAHPPSRQPSQSGQPADLLEHREPRRLLRRRGRRRARPCRHRPPTPPPSPSRAKLTARATHRRFWLLSTQRPHTKAPAKPDLLWKSRRPLKRLERARTGGVAAANRPPPRWRPLGHAERRQPELVPLVVVLALLRGVPYGGPRNSAGPPGLSRACAAAAAWVGGRVSAPAPSASSASSSDGTSWPCGGASAP